MTRMLLLRQGLENAIFKSWCQFRYPRVTIFKVSALDSCTRYFNHDNEFQGALGIVVDDILFFGSSEALQAEKDTANKFKNKGIRSLPFVFNGYEIEREKGTTSRVTLEASDSLVPYPKTHTFRDVSVFGYGYHSLF